jgi:hypothetical protein
MLDLFKSIRTLIKIEQVCIDNNVFRLHYKATVILLFTCSILVTAKQFFGDPISCIVDKDKDLQKAIETYCWIESTFSLPNRFGDKIGTQVPHPGIANYSPYSDEETKYHKYYQWVCFTLFFQGKLNKFELLVFITVKNYLNSNLTVIFLLKFLSFSHLF